MYKSLGIHIILKCVLIITVLNLSAFPNGVIAAELDKATIVTEIYKEDFLKYPQIVGLKNLEAQKKINEILLNHVKTSFEGYQKLKKEMEEYKRGVDCVKQAPTCNYSYNTYYEVKYNQTGKLSILIYDATYSGGAHGLEGVTTYNFNIQNGKRYTLDDLVSNQNDYVTLTDYVKHYMKEHRDVFFDQEILKKFTLSKMTHFYFTQEGIDLIFQQYEVAPYAVGHPTISIPNSLLTIST
nr:DUF3298 and DUF4163 domain-containing protein [Lysinibacillus timonensis]